MFRQSEARPPVANCYHCSDLVEVYCLYEIDTQQFCQPCIDALYGKYDATEEVSYSKESLVDALATLGYDPNEIETYRIYRLVEASFDWEMDVDNVIGHVEDHDYERTDVLLMVQYYLCKAQRDDTFAINDVMASQLLQRAVLG